MIWDYCCHECGTIREYQSSVEDRDNQCCRVCDSILERVFQPAEVMLPERFTKYSRSILEPTKAELLEIDRRNDEYLNNKPREKPQPTFDDCLKAECLERRIEPKLVYQYQGKQRINGR